MTAVLLALALGFVSGLRTFTPVAAVLLVRGGIGGIVLAVAAVGEYVWDVLPNTPSRTQAWGFRKTAMADDVKGQVVLLYFGYTFCPDTCPLTLANVDLVLNALGDKARDVRVLFVTIDPNRDTLPVRLPEVIGLRGDPDQLAALAKR